jgi:hypothetical protein
MFAETADTHARFTFGESIEPVSSVWNARDGMARSTGPILAVGGITIANQSLLSPKQEPIDFRVIVGTAVAAGLFALLERVSEQLAVGVAWVALLTTIFVPLRNQPSPAENLIRITGWNK